MSLSDRVNKFHESIRLENEQQEKLIEDKKNGIRKYLRDQEKYRLERKVSVIKQILDDPNIELDIPNLYKVELSSDRIPSMHKLVVMTERIKKVIETIEDCRYDRFEKELVNYSLMYNFFIWEDSRFYNLNISLYDKTKLSPKEFEEFKNQIDKANKIIQIIYNAPEKELSKKYMLSIFAKYKSDYTEERRMFKISTTAKGAELIRAVEFMKQCTKVEPIEIIERVKNGIKRSFSMTSR